MKIGVYGSAAGNFSEQLIEKAQELGREIARQKHILITGACPGLPYQAVLGAMELKGRVIGYSPAVDMNSHKALDYPTQGFSKIIFIPRTYAYRDNIPACRKFRNISSVLACDAAIFISGRSGTLNEFTNAYDFGKIIGVLEGSGGISEIAPAILKAFGNKLEARVISEKDPIKLVRQVIDRF
jgi:hypothetical protein